MLLEKIFTVSELTFAIKKWLEKEYSYLTVKGEITNFKAQSSGHLYFTLKDESAQISVAMFRMDAKTLSRLPKAGDKVIVQGEISVYPPRGNYQLIVRKLQFEGVGELLLKFHQLKEKLEKKGWFLNEHKKELPPFPKTIGVITSPTGSVIQDIINVLNRRFSGFHLILNPVRVQGEEAAKEIAQAIIQMNKHPVADILIVCRGGGSLEDLWAFNEEIVADAIFNSSIPIISAVGHETDITLADYVADVRAPTPSAAAEIALAEKAGHLSNLILSKKRIAHSLKARLTTYRAHIRGLQKQPLIATSRTLLSPFSQRLDEVSNSIDTKLHALMEHKKLAFLVAKRGIQAKNPSTQLKDWTLKFFQMRNFLEHSIRSELHQKKKGLIQLISHIKGIDPKNLLQKGYCLLFSENKKSLILSTSTIEKENKINIVMHDGEIKATVNEVQ
jgi:exodeoxyribonuclease VII large subunit